MIEGKFPWEFALYQLYKVLIALKIIILSDLYEGDHTDRSHTIYT